jgi:hypothetical protein
MADLDEPRIARRADVEWEELDGEMIAYDPRSATFHRFNTTATAVWCACASTGSIAEIVHLMRSAYAAPAGEIERDVRRAVDTFLAQGLVVVG